MRRDVYRLDGGFVQVCGVPSRFAGPLAELPPVLGDPVRGHPVLGCTQRHRPRADEVVQAVLQAVFDAIAELAGGWLRPQVGRGAGRAAELEGDEVVELLGAEPSGGRAGDSVGDLALDFDGPRRRGGRPDAAGVARTADRGPDVSLRDPGIAGARCAV